MKPKELKKKKIIVIGAGISGLSAGIYGLKSGFDVTIIEKNPVVGGLCTGWYRQGHYLDGCIHWMTGTKEDTILNQMWKDVGAFSSQDDIIYLPSWGTYDYKGQRVTLWKDIDRAEREWIELSKEDTKEIKKFFKMIRDFAKVELPLALPISWIPLNRLLKLGFKVLSIWPSYLKTMRMSKVEYAKRFKSEAIRFAITSCQKGVGNLFSMLYSYATVVIGNGGIPKGGSLAMANRMKDQFLKLGGNLILNKPVKSIIREKKTAKGVLLEDGSEIESDYVISCVDANYALQTLLNNEYKINKLNRRYKKPHIHQGPSCAYVSILVNDDLKDLPTPYSFDCKPYQVGSRKSNCMTIRSYAYDKETYYKDGKCYLSIILDQSTDDYEYWSQLYKNKEEYKKKKEELAALVIDRIETQLPNLKGKIEVVDIATPVTYNRYTNSSRGEYMPYLLRHDKSGFAHNGKIGLKHFYLSGQWMQCPGGLPIAVSQGRFAIQRICKKNKLPYIFTPRHLTHKKK